MENKLKQLIKNLTDEEKSELKKMITVENDIDNHYQYMIENIIKKHHNKLRLETIKGLNQLKTDIEVLIDQTMNTYHKNEIDAETNIIKDLEQELMTKNNNQTFTKNNRSVKYLEEKCEKNVMSDINNFKTKLSSQYRLPKETDTNLLYEKIQESFDDFLKRASEWEKIEKYLSEKLSTLDKNTAIYIKRTEFADDAIAVLEKHGFKNYYKL